MVQFVIFSIIVLFYVLLGSFYGLDEISEVEVKDVAIALIKFVLSMFFFVNGVRYIVEWKVASQDSVILSIVGNMVVPFTSLFWMFGYNVLPVLSEKIVTLLALLSYIYFFMYRKRIIDFIKEVMPINGRDVRVLFNTYPPKCRSDMIGVDLVMFVMWLLPLLFTIE